MDSIDVFLIGSSHTRQGYSAKLIEEDTGKSVYLLAYNGMDPVFMREILHYLIEERKIKISHFVIEAYVNAATSSPRMKDYRLFNDAPWNLKLRFLSVLLSEGKDIGWRQIYELVVLGGNEPLIMAPLLNSLLNRESYHGSSVNKQARGVSQEKFLMLPKDIPDTVKSEIDPKQRAAYLDIFQLIRTHGLSSEFIETPMPATVVRTTVLQEGKKRLAKFIRENGFTYVDIAEEGRFDNQNPALFKDWNHLSSAGREVCSRALVARWIANSTL